LIEDAEGQRGLRRDDRVEFVADVEGSKNDPAFGFYKRPRKAALIGG
jgi:hypothetical protein